MGFEVIPRIISNTISLKRDKYFGGQNQTTPPPQQNGGARLSVNIEIFIGTLYFWMGSGGRGIIFLIKYWWRNVHCKMGAFSSVLWCLLVSLYTVSYGTSPWSSSVSDYTVALIFITWSSMETMPSDDQTILRKIYFKMSIWCITPPWEMISFISWSKVVRLSYQRFPVTALGLCRGLPIGSPCLDILQNIKIITLLHKSRVC